MESPGRTRPTKSPVSMKRTASTPKAPRVPMIHSGLKYSRPGIDIQFIAHNLMV
jgi:hypothetical protein